MKGAKTINQLQWKNLREAIKKFSTTGEQAFPAIEEAHKGCFLAFENDKNEIVFEKQHLQDGLDNLTETVISLCPQNSNITDVHKPILCVVKDVKYIRNPLDWDIKKDGIYMQWGNRYQGCFMPYKIKSMGGDKIRILDKLSCSISLPSSLWRIPEALIFSVINDIYS